MLRLALDRANPVIISNPTVSKAKAAAEKYKLPKYSSDAMDVINDPDVEAVWICSPSNVHADQIKACAAAGKHVFCEKPVGVDILQTIEAINACNDAGVKLMTALQRRFDPNFARIKEGIVNGEVGEPILIKLCSRDPEPPPFEYVKGGGGIFCDMAIHDLDMARFLMDSEPAEILASGSCNIDKSIETLPGPEAFDTAFILLKFTNGKEAAIDVCRKATYGYDQRAEVRSSGQEIVRSEERGVSTYYHLLYPTLELLAATCVCALPAPAPVPITYTVQVLGTNAMIQTDNNYPNTAKIFSSEFCGNADMPFDFFMSRYKEAYVQETLAFVDSLVKDKPSPCSGEDGLIALVMAIAAGLSSTEKRWVKFSEVSQDLCRLSSELPFDLEARRTTLTLTLTLTL